MTRVNQAFYMGMERLRGRPPTTGLDRVDEVFGVGAEDVVRVLRKYLDPDRCSAVVVR